MMTPDAAEGEDSLESGLSQDEGGFDFSDFELGRFCINFVIFVYVFSNFFSIFFNNIGDFI